MFLIPALAPMRSMIKLLLSFLSQTNMLILHSILTPVDRQIASCARLLQINQFALLLFMCSIYKRLLTSLLPNTYNPLFTYRFRLAYLYDRGSNFSIIPTNIVFFLIELYHILLLSYYSQHLSDIFIYLFSISFADI